MTAALDRLTPEQREAVVLKVYQGFKFDEMAEILEAPVSTIKSRLYTALDLMKTELAPITVRGPDEYLRQIERGPRLRFRRTARCRAAAMEQHLAAAANARLNSTSCGSRPPRCGCCRTRNSAADRVRLGQGIRAVSLRAVLRRLLEAGFGSGSVMAAALIVAQIFRWRIPGGPRLPAVVAQTPESTRQIDEAVAKAVGQVRAEDAQMTKAALAEVSRKHQQEHRRLMEAISVMQERQNAARCWRRGHAPQRSRDSEAEPGDEDFPPDRSRDALFRRDRAVVSLDSLKAVEASINDRIRSNVNDPYDLLGPRAAPISRATARSSRSK